MSAMTDEAVALVPYASDPALVPDAILDGTVRLAGEHDPEAARLRAREGLMALENLPYHFAVALGPMVEAMRAASEAIARACSAFMATPDGARLARMLDREDRGVPTRYDRHMARVAATPRRRKGHRRHR